MGFWSASDAPGAAWSNRFHGCSQDPPTSTDGLCTFIFTWEGDVGMFPRLALQLSLREAFETNPFVPDYH